MVNQADATLLSSLQETLSNFTVVSTLLKVKLCFSRHVVVTDLYTAQNSILHSGPAVQLFMVDIKPNAHSKASWGLLIRME